MKSGHFQFFYISFQFFLCKVFQSGRRHVTCPRHQIPQPLTEAMVYAMSLEVRVMCRPPLVRAAGLNRPARTTVSIQV